MNNVVSLDRVNACCSCAAREERKHTGPAADFQYNISWTDSACDSVGVCVEPAAVANHISVRAERIHLNVRRSKMWNHSRQKDTLHRPGPSRRARRCAKDRYAAQFAARERVRPDERATRILRRAAGDREAN